MDWSPKDKERWVRAANRVIGMSGSKARVVSPHGTGGMTNVEQRMNLFHLLQSALVYGVPGDIVDIGVYRGETSVLFGLVAQHHAPERSIHGFDTFSQGDAQIARIEANFASVGVALPVLHHGRVEATLPGELPAEICFASIDIGAPDNRDIKGSVLHSLESVYPHLSRGAVCVVQDYCDPSVADTWDPWPAVRLAVDEFLGDKPERISVPYAGYYSHAYFYKL